MTLLPNSPEWQERRRTEPGVGASDTAAVCGVGYETAWELARRMLGLDPPLEQNDEMRLGHKLEPVVASEYEDRTGRKLYSPPPFLRNEKYPWMYANVDRFVEGHSKLSVECKAPGKEMLRFWGEEGSDEVPIPYFLQVQHQMAVTGHTTTDVAVLFGGRVFKIYTVQRDDRIIEQIAESTREFWAKVSAGQLPEFDAEHPRARAAMAQAFGYVSDAEMELPQYAVEAWAKYRAAKDEIKVQEKIAAESLAKVEYALQGCATAKFPLGKRELYRVQVPDSIVTETDVAELSQRVGKVKRKGHVRIYERDRKKT